MFGLGRPTEEQRQEREDRSADRHEEKVRRRDARNARHGESCGCHDCDPD